MSSKKTYDNTPLQLVVQFISGDISFHELLDSKTHWLNKKDIQIIKNEVDLYHLFLLKLPLIYRRVVTKYAQKLSEQEIANSINLSKSTINDYFNKNKEVEPSSWIIAALSIALDLPFLFVSDNVTNLQSVDSFEEYHYKNIVNIIQLKELDYVIKEKQNGQRTIYGYLVEKGIVGDLSFRYLRIDTHAEFSLLEFFIDQKAIINVNDLQKFREELNIKFSYAFITNATLRPRYKKLVIPVLHWNLSSSQRLDSYTKILRKRDYTKVFDIP